MTIWTRDNITLGVALVAAATSAPALWISLRSAKAAEASVVEARRSADAAEQSAQAGERQASAAAESLALQQEAARPKVVLRVRRIGKGMFQLQNEGTATAVGLLLHPDDEDIVERHEDWGLALPPNDTREVCFSGADVPSKLRFTWEGQDVPEFVPVIY
ncbi:hypothetical protein [Streptomyces katrae]|uniref:hypothetical protein n=1 Tax=Streptomyces katrae TaxID=68223 RepID=UPI0004BF14E8|nr:hypothetical protein [Streptomyces katrae]